MSEFTVFEERPDADEAPATCQYTGCDNLPSHYVRFRDPKEYVCYCKSHAKEQLAEHSGKSVTPLT